MTPTNPLPNWSTASGILPSQWIDLAIAEGVISGSPVVDPGQVQPNSLDLRLASKGYRVRCSFLPGREGFQSKIEKFRSYSITVSDEGTVLETDCVYIFELAERLELPNHVTARANPKSSTGRLDVFTRLVTETGLMFDDVPAGYSGPLYLEVVPRSFAVIVRPGDTLAQIRFASGSPELSDAETRQHLDADDIIVDPYEGPLRSSNLLVRSGVFLSFGVFQKGETFGFRARKNRHPIDLREVGALAIKQYWERLYYTPGDPIILEPDEFYILGSRERVRLGPNICAEMVPFDAGSGEVRTHYAGFFDSGFGFANDVASGITAAAVVLEVRSRDVPYHIEEGNPLFRLALMRNAAQPDKLYGSGIGSNYQSQRLRLSKQFRFSGPEEDKFQPRFDFNS